MKLELGNVKGFQDFLPPESMKRRAVKEVIERIYKLYGFLPVETPIVEFDELMRSDSLEEDEAVSDRFRLQDRAGRNLGLRYEFTFQLAKLFALNPNIKLPFKRYQIGEVFRDEPTSSRRFKQFTQCDADIVGDSSVDADIECLCLITDVLKELKVEAEVELNNRKLMKSIIESVQITAIKSVMKELDKMDKMGEDFVKSNLRKYADSNQILTLFKLLEKNLKFFKENAFDGAAELEELMKRAALYGIKIKYNPFLVRGFGYYTGTIFEVKKKGVKETLAAGGRYDKTAGKYINRDIPAVGVTVGLDRIVEFAQVPIENTKTLIISLNKDKEAIKLAKVLRKSEISCITMFNRLGKAMEYADSLLIPYVIFVGEEEIRKEKFKLKEMKSGEERLLSEKSLISALKK